MIPSAQQEAKHVESVAGKITVKKFARQSHMLVRLGGNPMTMTLDPYAFSITEGEHSEMVTVQVGGVDLKMLIDSGANSNIIDEGTWERLKVKGVKCESQAANPGKKLYPYAFGQPLPVKGSFKCTVSVCDRSTKAEVLVIKGRGMSLLGKITVTELGVLKVGINIAADDEELREVRKAIAMGRFKSVGSVGQCRGSCVSLVSSLVSCTKDLSTCS